MYTSNDISLKSILHDMIICIMHDIVCMLTYGYVNWQEIPSRVSFESCDFGRVIKAKTADLSISEEYIVSS